MFPFSVYHAAAGWRNALHLLRSQ